MQLFPDYSFGLLNIWWYSLFYGIITIIIMSKISKDNKNRILTFPKYKNNIEKLILRVSFILGKILIVYSVFVSIKLFTISFYFGTIIYLIGLFSSVYAMWFFSKTELSEPITDGIYEISRHSMQVMNFIMWIGIGLVSNTYAVVIYALIFAIVSYPSLKKIQERYCMEQYGVKYIEYMNKTPRYLFFKLKYIERIKNYVKN